VYFSLKNIVPEVREKKNTGDAIKKRVVFNGASFLPPAKFRRNSQEKKIRTPTCLKYL
jgi:hypothetical protein